MGQTEKRFWENLEREGYREHQRQIKLVGAVLYLGRRKKKTIKGDIPQLDDSGRKRGQTFKEDITDQSMTGNWYHVTGQATEARFF